MCCCMFLSTVELHGWCNKIHLKLWRLIVWCMQRPIHHDHFNVQLHPLRAGRTESKTSLPASPISHIWPLNPVLPGDSPTDPAWPRSRHQVKTEAMHLWLRVTDGKLACHGLEGWRKWQHVLSWRHGGVGWSWFYRSRKLEQRTKPTSLLRWRKAPNWNSMNRHSGPSTRSGLKHVLYLPLFI